jgi:hypothetical protein
MLRREMVPVQMSPADLMPATCVSLWCTTAAADTITIVESAPTHAWMRADTMPLALHPDDRATNRLSRIR